jgi:hypothetical protein
MAKERARHPGDSRRGFSDPDVRVGRPGRGFDLGYKFHISLDHKRILPLAGTRAVGHPAEEKEPCTQYDEGRVHIEIW